MSRTLLLVTGAGRSGTSTAAGALFHLGVHVPGPYLKANASNPRGFYESSWSVKFHNDILKRAHVNITDGRPEAAGIVADAITEQDRDRLRAWVDEVSAGQPLTLVKDPRTTWTLPLWSQVADDLDLNLGHLVMLRHPAEVIGSRATHYAAGIETMGEAGFAVKNLAGWTNALLMTEKRTRGHRRAFVRYDDLLADWRTALRAATEDLRITLDGVASDQPHPVDDFIDPDLSRHRITWADVDVIPALETVASQVWTAVERLADNHGTDSDAEADLDAARARYAAMYLAAQQLAHDFTAAQVDAARRTAARPAQRPAPVPAQQVGGREALRILMNAGKSRAAALRRRS